IENIHGNDVNPPRSETTDGTAVARIVASIATSPMLSITASRIGPRSLRRPTEARLTRGTAGLLTRRQPHRAPMHSGLHTTHPRRGPGLSWALSRLPGRPAVPRGGGGPTDRCRMPGGLLRTVA